MPKHEPNKNKKFTGNKKNQNKQNSQPKKVMPKFVTYKQGMTVGDFADQINKPASDVIKKLMFLKIMATKNQSIDRENAELLAMEYNLDLQDEVVTDLTRFEEIIETDKEEDLVSRPPVVTIMGHVDHGKTTLLDTIRHSRVVSTEAGGITQHIGAYQVEKNGKKITFIDTPGHAAFTEMRARGARITDIVILVVAADDGVMPQTREAIDHAKASQCEIIVAVNKMDVPGANPDRVKQQLADLGLLSEEWGGDIPFVEVSALKNQGIDNLLETIQVVAELKELKANPNRQATGSVIEARLDKGRGPVATILVDNGTLRVQDYFAVGATYGKVRAMTNDLGDQIKEAEPGQAVEIIGLNDVPLAGDPFRVFEDEKTVRDIADERQNRAFDKQHNSKEVMSLEDFFNQASDDTKKMNLIIKADVQGSIEAFRGSIGKIDVEGADIDIVGTGVGAVTDGDILLAEASSAIIIGFGVGVPASVRELAKEKGVEIRTYRIIYEALDDIEAAMKGMLDPVFEEQVIGEAEVRETYSVSKVGTIAGCMVTSGVVRRNSMIKIVRNGKIIFEGKLGSLKRFKDDVKEVRQGFECGITIENYNDIKEGDIIEVSTMKEV
ncbi:MAG: translation initiation factor IF-2 [Candidatus Izemoplasmatales bacterium]|uniref:Translation initiation factor IF-2 n=1 Tax=Hujiaoplasma nucleasis TaxID=2725268 RepID=A0A7L6N3C8_9MOLU|nr:translation initiation factor IF-2 [Hujiaoplasma nucleasis]QLY40051.1 translation initiation factor IF-2 [Hujiaoplasma nucleasis]